MWHKPSLINKYVRLSPRNFYNITWCAPIFLHYFYADIQRSIHQSLFFFYSISCTVHQNLGHIKENTCDIHLKTHCFVNEHTIRKIASCDLIEMVARKFCICKNYTKMLFKHRPNKFYY